MNEYDISQWNWLAFVIAPLVIWSMFWKALALWHSARKADTAWFIVLTVVNTAGILELIYLFSRGKLRPGKLFKK